MSEPIQVKIAFDQYTLNGAPCEMPVIGPEGNIIAYWVKDLPFKVNGTEHYGISFFDKNKQYSGVLITLDNNEMLLYAVGQSGNSCTIEKPDFSRYPDIYAEVLADAKGKSLEQIVAGTELLSTNRISYYASRDMNPATPLKQYTKSLGEAAERKNSWLRRN